MPHHVTIDDLDQYLAEVLAALNPSVITGNYSGPGAGGIIPTRPATGLIEAYNRNDAGDGTLGVSDFGHYPYTYGPGTPAWRIGIAKTVNKTDPAGAAALLDYGGVNQAFSVDVTPTNGGEEFRLLSRVNDAGTEGYEFFFSYGSNSGGELLCGLRKIDGTVLANAVHVAGAGVFDGNPHTIEVAVNIGDFLVLVDSQPTKVFTDNPVSIQTGSKFGFDSSGTSTQFDNITLRNQPFFDNFDYLRTTPNDFAHNSMLFQGGYPQWTRYLGTAVANNRYGNGFETFESGDSKAGIVNDFGDPDVDLSYNYGVAYSGGDAGLNLRVADDHSTAAVGIYQNFGGVISVFENVPNADVLAYFNSGATPVATSGGGSSQNGSVRVKLKGQHLQVFYDRTGSSPVIDYTLTNPASASAKHGLTMYGGNYSVLSNFLMLPL